MVFIPASYCHPTPSAAGDWAKWFGADPCAVPWYLYVTIIFNSSGEGTCRATAFGRTVEVQRVAGVDTVCLSDPYFGLANSIANGGGAARNTANKIDVWQAHRDGLWTSSTQINIYADADAVNAITGGSINANSVFATAGGTSRTLATIPAGGNMGTPKPVGCAGSSTLYFQCTVYDDGTVSIP